MSVCVSLRFLAEGSVSSNLGQSRDGKVNSAVKHRDSDEETDTHATQTSTHIDWKASTQKKIFMRNMAHVKRSRFTMGICCYMPPTCIGVCESAGMCVLVDLSAYAMRVPLCALSEPCDIPCGRKDNGTVKRGAQGKQRRERMGKEASQESWVWISLKCSIWWVIIFTKAAKSILFPKGVSPTQCFLPRLPASFLPECQLVSIVCLFFRCRFQCFRTRSSGNHLLTFMSNLLGNSLLINTLVNKLTFHIGCSLLPLFVY